MARSVRHEGKVTCLSKLLRVDRRAAVRRRSRSHLNRRVGRQSRPIRWRPVEVRAYAERIELRQDGRIVGGHPRSFGRDKAVFDPWHYVLVLARKPGALRNGAPFKDWVLPSGLKRIRRKLAGVNDGDRQMVAILTTVLSDGLPAVEAACNEALLENVHSADVILNILARRRETVDRPRR